MGPHGPARRRPAGRGLAANLDRRLIDPGDPRTVVPSCLQGDARAEAEHRPGAFAEQVDNVLRPEGYRLVGFFVKDDLYAAAVAGFRVVHMLAWGHMLYCDDLGTRDEHRRHGYAGQLMR
jgi:GNAT superfamily N-acetyltransferase